MDEITLYLGTLAAIGIGGLVLIVVILTRGSGGGGKKQQRLRNDYQPTATPRVQVVLGDPDEGLIWVVNGRATRDLAAITDPTERRALELLVERVHAVDLPFELLESTDPLPLPPITATPDSTTQSVMSPPTDSGTPLAETPAAPPTPPPSPTYEDELARPFLSRLRDSLFGVDYETKPSQRMYTPRPVPTPSKGKSKESDDDSGFGLPRFEELNLLLQQRLALIPDAPPTNIRQGRNGMLEILVEGRVYDHIDEVPDETVRQAMREAVAIWNGR